MARTVSKSLPAVLAVMNPVASGTTRYHTLPTTSPAQSGCGSPGSILAPAVEPSVETSAPLAGTKSTLAPAKLSLANGVPVGVRTAVAVTVGVAVGVAVAVAVVGVALDVAV